MKIKITVEVIEAKYGTDFTEAQKMLQLAASGIVSKYAVRLKGMGNNVWGSWLNNQATSTVIELENEEEKKAEA